MQKGNYKYKMLIIIDLTLILDARGSWWWAKMLIILGIEVEKIVLFKELWVHSDLPNLPYVPVPNFSYQLCFFGQVRFPITLTQIQFYAHSCDEAQSLELWKFKHELSTQYWNIIPSSSLGTIIGGHFSCGSIKTITNICQRLF